MFGEPDTVLRQEERKPGRVHRAGTDRENDVIAATSRSHDTRRLDVDREMHVRSGSTSEPRPQDALEKAHDRAVKEKLGRLARHEPEIDVDRMPLTRTNARAVGGERVAPRVVADYDGLELALVDRFAERCEAAEDRIDIGPTRTVEDESESRRLVP